MADQVIKNSQGLSVQIIKDYGGGFKSIYSGRGDYEGSIVKK
jgi:hypothetical protein